MRTVAVIGRKGGSGKTTIAAHLAIGLHLRGRRTILADCDPQRSAIEVLKSRGSDGPETIATSSAKIFVLRMSALNSGVDALVIDTPAVLDEDIAQAAGLADLSIMVVRPTFLDISAAVRTSSIVRKLRKPGLIILNQAPAPRGQVEAPTVKRSMTALGLLHLPVAPIIVRARATYQTVLEHGRSAEELGQDGQAASEMKALCDYIDRFVFGGQIRAANRKGSI